MLTLGHTWSDRKPVFWCSRDTTFFFSSVIVYTSSLNHICYPNNPKPIWARILCPVQAILVIFLLVLKKLVCCVIKVPVWNIVSEKTCWSWTIAAQCFFNLCRTQHDYASSLYIPYETLVRLAIKKLSRAICLCGYTSLQKVSGLNPVPGSRSYPNLLLNTYFSTVVT